jgi:hypothetical protein
VQTKGASRPRLNLRAGDRVEVRSEAEILATLDEHGELDSLPFMPEMLPYCGKVLTVDKVAHKVCDTITRGGLRRMERAVHLTGVRCDGSAHGGCQNACLVYWKEDWLMRAEGPAPEPLDDAELPSPRITLPLLEAATRKEPGPDGEERFACQTTELNRATPERLPFTDLGQYVTDVRSGNANLYWVVRAFLVGLFNRLQERSTRVLPRRLWFRGGKRWRFLTGRAVGRTPIVELGLQPGDHVRVKSKDAILDTLNANLLNRGMGFEEEMSRFCGREARVERRVQQVIDEKTSRMVQMKTPCVVLESLVCEGAYHANCPRAWTCFWREAWLERIDGP